jgi:hypothetical protein
VQDRTTHNLTGNVFSATGGPAQFVWCRWVAGTSYECLGSNGCDRVPCTWSEIATVNLPDSFFEVDGSAAPTPVPTPTPRIEPTPGRPPTPRPTGQPRTPLSQLLGTWNFYFFGDTFQYRLRQIVVGNNGIYILQGLDENNRSVSVVDTSQTSSDFEFGLVDPAGEACIVVVFNLVGQDAVSGGAVATEIVDGTCTSTPVGLESLMTGTRVSRTASIEEAAPIPDEGALQRALDATLGAARGSP